MDKKELLLGQLREMIRNEIRSALLPEEEHDFNKDLRAMGYNSLDAYNRDNPDRPMTNPYDTPTERPRRRLPPKPIPVSTPWVQAQDAALRKAQQGWTKLDNPYNPWLDSSLKGPARDTAVAQWEKENPEAAAKWYGRPPAGPQEEAVVIQPIGDLKALLDKLRSTSIHKSKTPVQIIQRPEIDYLPGDEGEPGDSREFGEDDVEEVLMRLRETQTYKNK